MVHFDGKILSDSSGNIGDRLALIISGNTREYRQGKLLSAKNIADGTGQSQADEVVSTLTEWNLTDNVVGMCFDTTIVQILDGCQVRLFELKISFRNHYFGCHVENILPNSY